MIIHQIFWPFKGKKLNDIPVFRKNVNLTKEYCKEHGYTYCLWNLRMCEELLCDKYPEYICLWEEFRFDIQKCDFIRYLILHHCGGWYVDCDVHPIQDLSSLSHYKEVFTTWSNDVHRKPYNAVMMSQRNNPLFIEIMKECQKRVIEKQSIKQYDTWKGRLVFQTTGHNMLRNVVPKESIHELMLIHNEKKGIYVTSNNPYFYDSNASVWY